MLPPIKYNDESENVEFKSFNTKYLIWLCSHNGFNILYNKFLDLYYKEIFDMFIKQYHIANQIELNQIKYYIRNFGSIFANFENAVEEVKFKQIEPKEEVNVDDNKIDIFCCNKFFKNNEKWQRRFSVGSWRYASFHLCE